jgi:hypothetical protein
LVGGACCAVGSAAQSRGVDAGQVAGLLVLLGVVGVLRVTAEVSYSNGPQLGGGQCELDWQDSATNWQHTTGCNVTATERSVTKPGVHRSTVEARGLGGLLARGSGSVPVTVSG